MPLYYIPFPIQEQHFPNLPPSPERQGRCPLYPLLLKKCSVGKMVERIKVLANRPDDPSLIPETYMVEGENLIQLLL